LTNPFSRPTFPGVLTFVVGASFGFTQGLYAALQLEEPGAMPFVQKILFIWSIGWWIQKDSRTRGIGWPTDLGFFLWIAWPIVLFFHLFRTRRLKALLLIAGYFAVFLTAAIAGVVLSILITV
jgi:hypothetical protein